MKFITVLLVFVFTMFSVFANDLAIEKGQLLQAHSIKSGIKNSNKSDNCKVLINNLTNKSGWKSNGSWQQDDTDIKSISSFSTSKNTQVKQLKSQLISPMIDISNCDLLKIDYIESFEIESEYDKGFVKVSFDNKDNWQTIAQVSGKSSTRTTTVHAKNNNHTSMRLMFEYQIDDSIEFEGWTIEDVTVSRVDRDSLSVNITSLNSQNFPFIYMNVAVDSSGVGISSLSSSDFSVYENGVLQEDFYEVVPPASGGSSRLADIVFLMDNSGSMSDEQNAVSNNVSDFIDQLNATGVDCALGLCRFGGENSGYPIIEENGLLTSDTDYFKNSIWTRNHTSGGFEPGWDALYDSATQFSFRPGSQKIFILITDENCQYSNQGHYSQQEALTILNNSTITTFSLISTDSGSIQDYGYISEQTNGEYMDIYSPFDDILTAISSQVSNTYVVRYRSSDIAFNGLERIVDITANYLGAIDTATASYTPGTSPDITRTGNTLAYHNQAWAEESTFMIEALIEDSIEPFTQSAKLYYKNSSESYYSTINLTNIGGNIWQAEIPYTAVLSPGLDYYFTATDGQSTSSLPAVEPNSNPFQIAILPNVAPVISHIPIQSAGLNTDVTVNASVIDTTNYITSVSLYHRAQGELLFQEEEMTLVSGNLYTGNIHIASNNMGGTEYYIKATDNFNVSSHYGSPDQPILIQVMETTILQGYVKSLEDNQPIVNAQVSVGNLTTTTDSLGFYEILDIPLSEIHANFTADQFSGMNPLDIHFTDLSYDNKYTVTAHADDYIDYYSSNVSIHENNVNSMNFYLDDMPPTGDLIVKLSWDSDEFIGLMMKANIGNEMYYVDQFDGLWGSDDSLPYAYYQSSMNIHERTIVLNQFMNTTYMFYAQSFLNDQEISEVLNLQAKIYRADVLIDEVTLTSTELGGYWHIGNFNGYMQEFIPVNSISQSEPNDTRNSHEADIESNQLRTCNQWKWSFGDGSVSYQQNPIHSYEQPGYYNVKLKVTNDNGYDVCTKDNYILVEDVEGNPDIHSTSEGITMTLYPDQNDSSSISFENIGDADLEYNVKVINNRNTYNNANRPRKSNVLANSKRYSSNVLPRINKTSQEALMQDSENRDNSRYTIFFDDMEGEISDWETVNYAGSDLWHLQDETYNSDNHAWSCSVPDTYSYNNGQLVHNALITPEIEIPANNENVYLEFQENYITETNYDRCAVAITNDGYNWQELRGNYLSVSAGTPAGNSGGWIQSCYNISEYVGETVQIRFTFYTQDNFNNNFPGWFIDDVKVYNNALSWVRPNINCGILQPSLDQTVELDFRSYNLEIASYQADVCIESNDLDEPNYLIPITLNVVEMPIIELSIPENVNMQVNNSDIILSFDVVENAQSYLIYACDSPDGEYTLVSNDRFQFSTSGNRVTWLHPATEEMKFFYIKASTETTDSSRIKKKITLIKADKYLSLE